jgi:hypothetical protein
MDLGCDDSEDYCGSALQVAQDFGREESRVAKGKFFRGRTRTHGLRSWQYVSDLVANAEAARQEKITRLRPHFKKLFQQNKDRIKAYSTFRTAEKLFENDRVWNSLERAEDRKTLFDEYVHDLKTAKQVRFGPQSPRMSN